MAVARESAIKITLVGDYVGKTNLISSYLYNKYPEHEIKLCECYETTISVDNKEYPVQIQDSPSLEEWEGLRPLLYVNTSCFLMCYSRSQRATYENIYAKWLPEIRHKMPHTPIILVATTADYRARPNEKIVTSSEGKSLQKQIEAEHYIECSAEERKNLKVLFEEAVRCSIKHNTRTTGSKPCILM
ncbi:hypothetical protein ILUMI_01863 [Ignelater luminosus]|uniref:Uncharacterized protein n=1 Tax=Ignelater luminosus TaxID=2038154 RepID=A0A8K0DEI6_IGNLU|nr:hypothetical protein ILUMI_01863 [Ignelater luminosus]